MSKLLEKLAYHQTKHSFLWLVLAVIMIALSWPFVSKLGLDTSWEALLPQDKPSVQDLKRVGKRLGGLSTLIPVIQSRDTEALKRFARDLVPRLNGLSKYGVHSVEWNLGQYEDFVLKHKFLYADLEDLKEIRDGLEERLIYEKLRKNPLYVDLTDEAPPDPEELIDRIEKKSKESKQKQARFAGGFYIHPEGHHLFIFLRTDISGGDAKTVKKLIAAVDAEVHHLNPKRYAPDLKVEYAGDLLRAGEEHDAIKQELLVAIILTVVLVLVAILVFFRRFRALPLLGGAMVVPILLTFAFAQIIVGNLNSSTAFLGSIIIGNGSNPNVIWLARYFEERRNGNSVLDSIKTTHLTSWKATLVASFAAAFAYGSLVITEFQGFRDFGIIGGIGMLLGWLGSMTILPVLTALYERMRPMPKESIPVAEQTTIYGTIFSKLAFAAPRAVVTTSLLLTAIGVTAIVVAIVRDPIEYNFRKLSSRREGASRAAELMKRVKETVGQAGAGNGIAMWIPNRSEVAETKARLEARRDNRNAPIGNVRSIDDLLPEHQPAKIALLGEIREQLLEIRSFATDEQKAKIDAHLPPESVQLLTEDALPAQSVRLFTERDGTRGRILFIEQDPDRNTWDGRYLVEWSNELRTVRMKDGSTPALAGRAPVFADILEAVWVDGPKAVTASFIITLCLVIFGFRARRERWLTMLSLLVGITWMAGTLALMGMKLNFLNFVAFPITFGTGVDYGVNLVKRFSAETKAGLTDMRAIRVAVKQSGGAVTLCSLTTMIGYSSLFTSANQALRSFGAAMTISEITCLLSAGIVLPAWIAMRGDKRPRVASKTNMRRSNHKHSTAH